MPLYMFVGSCNRPTPYFKQANGDGVSVFTFDARAGTAELVSNYADIDNPTFLSVSSDATRIYANSEIFGRPQGLVTALSFDPGSGAIRHIDMQPSRGSITSHNSLTADERYLLVTNYSLGHDGPDQSVVVFPLDREEGLGLCTSSVAHRGHGPHPERQERSHAHFVHQLPDGRVAVADLGLDRIVLYDLPWDGALETVNEVALPPGSGPRHLAWRRDGQTLFAVNELNSTVSALRRDAEGTSYSVVETAPTVPRPENNHCSDIAISPDDRFLYIGNRGHDSISVFSTKGLEQLAIAPCGGETPRNLALTPCGGWLLSANQDSDAITVFRRESETGQLEPSRPVEVGTPMCIKFVEA